jgi:hypothetical protein
MAKTNLTAERLRELFNYSPETGLFERIKRSNNRTPGSKVGTVTSYGYCALQIDGELYQMHRLAWLHSFGEFPEKGIDHINGIRSDNRLCNLREASQLENMQNTAIQKSNTSGHTGVVMDKRRGKWYARIVFNKKDIFLGYFDRFDDAKQARELAKERLHTFSPTVRVS